MCRCELRGWLNVEEPSQEAGIPSHFSLPSRDQTQVARLTQQSTFIHWDSSWSLNFANFLNFYFFPQVYLKAVLWCRSGEPAKAAGQPCGQERKHILCSWLVAQLWCPVCSKCIFFSYRAFIDKESHFEPRPICASLRGNQEVCHRFPLLPSGVMPQSHMPASCATPRRHQAITCFLFPYFPKRKLTSLRIYVTC